MRLRLPGSDAINRYQRNETTSPIGVSDDDPPVVRIALPKAWL
jgi:hypothetical protein